MRILFDSVSKSLIDLDNKFTEYVLKPQELYLCKSYHVLWECIAEKHNLPIIGLNCGKIVAATSLSKSEFNEFMRIGLILSALYTSETLSVPISYYSSTVLLYPDLTYYKIDVQIMDLILLRCNQRLPSKSILRDIDILTSLWYRLSILDLRSLNLYESIESLVDISMALYKWYSHRLKQWIPKGSFEIFNLICGEYPDIMWERLYKIDKTLTYPAFLPHKIDKMFDFRNTYTHESIKFPWDLGTPRFNPGNYDISEFKGDEELLPIYPFVTYLDEINTAFITTYDCFLVTQSLQTIISVFTWYIMCIEGQSAKKILFYRSIFETSPMILFT